MLKNFFSKKQKWLVIIAAVFLFIFIPKTSLAAEGDLIWNISTSTYCAYYYTGFNCDVAADNTGFYITNGSIIEKRNLDDGSLIWLSVSLQQTEYYGIAVGSNYIYAVGNSWSGGINQWIIDVYSKTGTKVYTYNSNPTTGPDASYAVTVGSDGIYVVGSQNYTARVEKRNFNGSGPVWSYNTSNSREFLAVAVGSDGIYVGGYRVPLYWRLEKLDFNGNFQWDYTGLSNNERGKIFNLAVDETGIYIAGSNCDTSSFSPEYGTLQKRSLNGQLKLWEIYRDGSNGNIPGAPLDIILAPQQTGVYLIGQVAKPGGFNDLWFIEKRDQNNNFLWNKTSQQPDYNDYPFGIALSSSNAIYIVGVEESIQFGKRGRIEKREAYILSPPAAPSDLIASPVSGTCLINLNWTDNSNNEDSFVLEQSTDGISFFQIPPYNLGPNSISTTDTTTKQPDTIYYYRVKACNTGGCSSYSNITSAVPDYCAPYCSNWDNVLYATALTGVDCEKIELSWGDAGGCNPKGNFTVERKTTGGFSVIAYNLSDSQYIYTDNGLTGGTYYTYRVKACNADGCTGYSNEASATAESCTTPQAYWAEDTAGFINISSLSVDPDTTSVYMVAKNTGLPNGASVSFTIKEKDLGIDPDDTIKTINAVSNGGTAIAEWKILRSDLDKTKDDYDYFYFTTGVVPDSGGLNITIAECPPEPPSCSGYKDPGSCIDDSCSVANSDGNTKGIDCTNPKYSCKCIWNPTDGCKFFWNGTIPKYCGNNITGPGEECDGNPPGKYDWGEITGCSDFDLFTGGNLKCGNDCKFDTTSCLGGALGSCGDGAVNTGETCDGTNWGSIIGCQNFDNFTTGDLSCGADCHFDTNKCKKNINDPESWGSCEGMYEGSCEYTDDTSGNCDDGFFSYSWIADWTWNQDNDFDGSIPIWGNPIDFFNDGGIWRCATTYIDCQGGSTTYECPSRIKLPFFSFLNLVVAALVIILIYVIINSKKKNSIKKFFKKK